MVLISTNKSSSDMDNVLDHKCEIVTYAYFTEQPFMHSP